MKPLATQATHRGDGPPGGPMTPPRGRRRAGLRRVGWAVTTVLAAATALLGARYFSLDPNTFLPEQRAVYLAHLAPLLLHIGGGVLALLLGPWQFLPRLRTRRPAVHRFVGRAYLVSAVVAGIGGLSLAPRALVAPIAPIGFALLAALLLGASAAAYATARRREFARHRIWATRSYALILAAVTLRLWLLGFEALGLSFDLAYGSAAWASWLINLLVAEFVIARPGAADGRVEVRRGSATGRDGPDVSAPAEATRRRG
ncbi:DUF2306 domain-containing protein [Kitasatospora sp. NPDC059327]|uniref:DUF2306 domain-containing protein n=1 Tax=Kitasatospora sp. NPDC059327 TaxID=3346803 RepID=UPI00368207A9